MPKVASFTADGLELWLKLHDHLPPHFHAEKPGERGVRVYFLRLPKEMVDKIMNAAVEILAPTDPEKVKKVVGRIGKARVVRSPSKEGRDWQVLVAWVSDLETAKRRRDLMQAVDLIMEVPGGALILLEAKSPQRRSYQTLETLATWGRLSRFYLAPSADSVRRIVQAHLAGAETDLVASAMIEDDRLVVWSCEPKRYVVSTKDIPALARMNRKDRERFTLGESGSRLHWLDGDVDLDMHAIRYYADPKAKRAQDRARREDAARYAGAIRAVRKERGLSQSDISGLTERQVRRIERGESIPQSETLKKLAIAHGLSLDEYLAELANWSAERRRPA